MTNLRPRLVVLVHGGSHDGWCWRLVQEELDQRDVASVAPDLPFTSVADDVACVRQACDTAIGPVALVGHSRGGRIITMAASGTAKVSRLVYIAAMMLAEGESQPPGDHPSALSSVQPLPSGVLSAHDAREIFYHDVPAELADEAIRRLRPVPASAKGAASSEPASWRHIRSTYVVCSDDHCLHPDSQRTMASSAAASYELPSSHSPFLSKPKELAEIIAAVAWEDLDSEQSVLHS